MAVPRWHTAGLSAACKRPFLKRQEAIEWSRLSCESQPASSRAWTASRRAASVEAASEEQHDGHEMRVALADVKQLHLFLEGILKAP